MSKSNAPAPAKAAGPEVLSRPIRGLFWLSIFTEIAIIVTIPFALFFGVAELVSSGEHSLEVRIWAACVIALTPFHIVCVDRLLRRPRRSAPPQLAASALFSGIFVIAMLVITLVVVAVPALEMVKDLVRGHVIAPHRVAGYLGVMVFYQVVLWMAWLATPQLDIASTEPRLRWLRSKASSDAA